MCKMWPKISSQAKLCVSFKTKTQNSVRHYRSIHGPRIGDVQRRSGSWRPTNRKSWVNIFRISPDSTGFFRISQDFFGLVVFRGGQGAGGQQVAHPEWRFFGFPRNFPRFYRIFPGFVPATQFWWRNFAATKIATNSSQPYINHTKNKNNIIITYCKLFKIWRKKSLFWLFSWCWWVLICNILPMSDFTVLQKWRRKVQ